MGKTLPDTCPGLAWAVMELADSFGVFASLFCLERHTRKTLWRGGRLLERSTRVSQLAAVTVVTARGDVGHARVERLSRSALERAFHAARRGALPDPAAASLLRTFAQYEQKAPPLLAGADDERWRHLALDRAAESRHLKLAGTLADGLGTLLTVSCDRMAAVRSDGVSHRTAVWRARCDAWWRGPGGGPHHWCGGTSGFSRSALYPEAVFAGLSERMEQAQDAAEADLPEVAPDRVISPGACLLDAAVLARIAHAWLFLPASRHHRFPAVEAVVEQLEGTPGYTPLHPYGYLWPPVCVTSSDAAGRGVPGALCTLPPDIGGHLSLKLPALDAPDREERPHPARPHPLLAVRGFADGEEWIAFEGVRHFWLDEPSATFLLMPVRLYRVHDGAVAPLPPAWWRGSVPGVLAGCVGGLGPERLAWASPATEWTVSAPAYAVVRPGRVDASNDGRSR